MNKKFIFIIVIFLVILLGILTKYSIIDGVKDKKTSDINNYTFELDSANKYVITTDLRWITMQNDGGSHTSIYYQIDLDNNVIIKVEEAYKANLAGKPSTEKDIIYTKKIDNQIFIEEIKSFLNDLISKEDVNELNNYNFFTLSSLNYEKNLYNTTTIKIINSLLEKIDEFERNKCIRCSTMNFENCLTNAKNNAILIIA